MVELLHVATRLSAPTGYFTGLSDIVLQESAGAQRLYTVSAAGGGVLALNPNTALSALSQAAFPQASVQLDAPRQLLSTTVNGTRAMVSTGQFGTTIDVFPIGPSGLLTAPYSLSMTGSDVVIGASLALATFDLNGAQVFAIASRQDVGLSLWRSVGGNQLERIAQYAVADILPSGGIAALAQYDVGPQRYLLALSAQNDGLFCYRVGASGTLDLAGRVDGRDGLAICLGTTLKLVSVAGQNYALVGAAGSGSLAVVALTGDGRMIVTDHIMDDRATRFADLTELATVTVNGQTYIAAAGSDDGVSLFTLLPGGRLVHLTTIEDSSLTALTNPSGLALSWQNDGLDLFVAGYAPGAPEGSGISQFRASLGQIGATLQMANGGGLAVGTAGRDQIVGGSGNDLIQGGAGDDIMVDGDGSDTLTGGAGRDVFIFTADGKTDRVTDFEPGVDRMDLSALGRFYTLDVIGYTATQSGGIITIGNEQIIISTANGSSLALSGLKISDLLDVTHLIVAPSLEQSIVRFGTTAADFMDGREGADTMVGQSGADTLFGNAGDDCLMGGAIDGRFDEISGQVFRLYQATLGREPDLMGIVGWVRSMMTQQNSLAAVTSGFVNSSEFRTTYGNTSNKAFVELLYHNVLNRAPDPGGLSGWVGLLTSGGGSRVDVVLGFSESAELRNRTEAAEMAFSKEGMQQQFFDDVFRLYQATLDRNPDPVGLEGWAKHLADGNSYSVVVSGFVNSAEFRANYGATSNQQFVNLLYQNVLNRAPDSEGLKNWVGALSSGALSREQVVEGFAQSAEFINNMQAPMAQWVRDLGTDDVLDGGGGANILFGGLYSDTFVFHVVEASNTTVQGLEVWDKLRFDGFGYQSPSDARSHMHQDGNRVLFEDQGQTVQFLNAHLSDMSDGVFLF